MSSLQWPLWTLVGIVTVIFIAANAHLVYIAVASDPGCVTHLKTAGSAEGQYRAAKSAC
ncbi:hypothetical protein [Pseudorhizobium flavum]|uniref:hypothetical protein n=1 Tax=Pseudorhizobium flavum TaxID=1335061 RepID=UPI0024907C0D|nr:hypothetical protein [Pseudorhizobium flavum]